MSQNALFWFLGLRLGVDLGVGIPLIVCINNYISGRSLQDQHVWVGAWVGGCV